MDRAEVCVLGGGRMGSALVGGLIESGFCEAGNLVVAEIDVERRRALAEELPGVTVVDRPVGADGAILAVKPAGAIEGIERLVEAGVGRIVSIAAGVTLERLESAAGNVPVVRAMPNTPSLLGAGAAGVARGARAGDVDVAWAVAALSAVGIVEVVPEHLLDAVTGLSGSGPAYVFLLAEAMVEAGVLEGLPRQTAERLAHQTIAGAGRLLTEENDSAGALRQAVTSPGGTTAAGLRQLERAGVRAAVLDAVSAATLRSKELS